MGDGRFGMKYSLKLDNELAPLRTKLWCECHKGAKQKNYMHSGRYYLGHEACGLCNLPKHKKSKR